MSGMMSALTSAVAADTARPSSITTTCDRGRAQRHGPARPARTAAALTPNAQPPVAGSTAACSGFATTRSPWPSCSPSTPPGRLRRRSGGRCSPRCTGTSTPCSARTRTRNCWPRPRPSRAPGDRLLRPRRQLRLPGQPGEVSGSLRRARPAAPAAGTRAGRGGPRRRIQLPHPDPRTRQRRPRSHAPRRAACHGGRPQPRPSRTNRRPPPTPDGQGRCLAGTAAALVGAAAARWALIRPAQPGEAAPVHQESAAYCAGGGTGVAVILI